MRDQMYSDQRLIVFTISIIQILAGDSVSNKNKPTIKTLWIGTELSSIEQLSIKSFLAWNHQVELFVYSDVKHIPPGAILRNANEILPESLIFRYKHNKSLAAFANWFRYKLLHEEGGIWVDLDVVCLKPFQFDRELIFGKEEYGKFNNAVLGGQPGHPLFKFMMDQAASPNSFLPFDTFNEKRRKLNRKYLQGNNRGNLKWGETGPVGLSKAIYYLGLEDYALPYTAFYPIHPKCWDSIFDSTYPDPDKTFPNSFAIHLWNEMVKSNSLYGKDKQYPKDSLIEALKKRFL